MGSQEEGINPGHKKVKEYQVSCHLRMLSFLPSSLCLFLPCNGQVSTSPWPLVCACARVFLPDQSSRCSLQTLESLPIPQQAPPSLDWNSSFCLCPGKGGRTRRPEPLAEAEEPGRQFLPEHSQRRPKLSSSAIKLERRAMPPA